MQDLSFDEWFDKFFENCNALGYSGNIDKDSFEYDWEEGKTPKDAAKEFVDEMNE